MHEITPKGPWAWDADELARELDAIGWPSVADDAREGVRPATILKRLHEIGEGYSDAAEIVAEYDF